jgi:DAK2 domain fusion protein YloV
MSTRRLDATALREWAHAAVTHLIECTDEINRLNVFPVADADTGTNMLFTMRAACACADSHRTSGVVGVAAALAEGALQGARGNSGVILSQILRGLADVTLAASERDGALADVDGPLLASAMRHAVWLAEASVSTVPGTIVSVLSDAAGAAEDAAADGADVADVVRQASEAAVVSLEKTPQQLTVLAEAGVVDAGGRGLLVLLDALTETLVGVAPHRVAYEPSGTGAGPATSVPVVAPPGFEVMSLLNGCDHRGVELLRTRLEQLGESIAIAASGTDGRFSVHVHADDAGKAIESALDVGVPSRIQITALTGTAGARRPGGWTRDRAVLAIVDGDGAAALFEGEGAHVLRPDGDSAIRAHHLLRALVDAAAAQIMVLPNGYVAAEELVAGCTAAMGWGIDVVPVPAGSMVQGLAALAVHDAGRQAVDDGYTMARAAAGARHASVRLATEEALTWAGTCTPGDGLGISGDEVLIVGRDVTAAGAGLIDLLLSSGGELVTVLTGAGVDPGVGAALQDHVHQQHLGAELVTYHTGHRGDALLIGVE